MLGQPVSMLIPKVVGFKLSGAIPTGVTATDVVLTITEMLRKHGVVGKFVEFYGSGRGLRAPGQPRHDRQHEPRVRLDRRDVPDRRGHAGLPAPHRPQRRAGRARGGVLEAADALARPREGAGLQRVPRTGPRDRRPLDRRTEATAGPHHPRERQDPVRERSDQLRRRRARPRRPGGLGVVPGIRPSRATRPDDEYSAAHPPPPQPRPAEGLQADAGRAARTARGSRSTTAPSRSPRSRRARTRRTRRSCSPQDCSPATRSRRG